MVSGAKNISNESSYSFPSELISQSSENKINYFKNYGVMHHNLSMVRDQLLDSLENPIENSIILVFGPTGVGKSRLFELTAESVLKKNLSLMSEDLGFIPIAGMEAIAPENGSFNWKDHYSRCLKSLNEPLISKKLKIQRDTINLFEGEIPSVAGLRRSLENALKYRKLQAYLIDEAQHMAIAATGRKLSIHMETIKSIASISKVPHVLFGTYELLKFRNLSGQLIRRGTDIHLSRYMANDIDFQHFIDVLGAFQTHLPVERQPLLVDDFDFFYERSIGCIGILKDWLLNVLRKAVTDNKKTITLDDCKKYALSLDKCIHLIKEAKEGEMLLEEQMEKENELSRLLGMDEKPINKSIDNGSTRKVGERKPSRDVVGN